MKDPGTLFHHRDFASITSSWLALRTKTRLNKKSIDDSFSNTEVSRNSDDLPSSVIRSEQIIQPNSQKSITRQQLIYCPPPLPATREGRVLFAPDFLIPFVGGTMFFVGAGFALVRWLRPNDSKEPNTNND